MNRTIRLAVALVVALTVAVSTMPASADLSAIGAVNPATGFPSFVVAQNGLSALPCSIITNPAGGLNGPPCGGLALLDFAGGFVANNIEEVFYYMAEAISPNASRLRIEVQGGCANLPIPPNPFICDAVLINDVGLRIQPGDLPAAGRYTVVTPVGRFLFDIADILNPFVTALPGGAIGIAPTFAGAIPGSVQFFVPNGTGAAGFFGDGLTPAPLQAGFGWPAQDPLAAGPGELAFRVIAPNGVTVTVNETAFVVEGRRQGRFNDVPVTHPFFNFIESVAAAGITSGCSANPPLYCPDATITRAQMAVFILTSLGVTPRVCTGTRFSDVSPLTVGQAFCNFIEEFAARGITAGCGGGLYCPNNPVTRAEMAVFVERALGVAAPPACNGLRFGDVNATVMSPVLCGFIEDFALKGITGGCQIGPPPLFCPTGLVTRGQMAVFLVAAPPPLLP